MKFFLRIIYFLFLIIIAFGVIGILYTLNQKDNASASTVINDTANPGAIVATGRTIVRDSSGNLYMIMNASGICEVWKSTNGTSWSEVDSAHHPTCISGANGFSAIAIDSTNKLHIAYNSSNTSLKYNTITSDAYGTEENVPAGTTTTFSGIDIAIDSNNLPHITFSVFSFTLDSNYIRYSNRVSGSWKATPVQVVNQVDPMASVTMAIDKDNKPEACYVKAALGIAAVLGNLNNATSFTENIVDATSNTTAGQTGCSLSIDPSGNSWLAYVDSTGTNNINLIKHVYGDAWTTWQTAVTDSQVGCEPQISYTSSASYIFYTACSGAGTTGNIVYDKYDGSSWSGQITLQTGTFQDVHAKWSYLNDNQASTQIDYLFSDSTDIYWDKLTLAAPTDTPTPTPTPTLTPTPTPLVDVQIRGGSTLRGGTKIR